MPSTSRLVSFALASALSCTSVAADQAPLSLQADCKADDSCTPPWVPDEDDAGVSLRQLRVRELHQAAGSRETQGSVAAASDDPPDVSVAGIPAVKAWATARNVEGERAWSATGLERNPSPPSWEGLVIYQIQVDRFNNGDLANDALNRPDWQTKQMANKDLAGMPDWRHGGDLQGIRDRLGYLADLGVQALWVTPILQHTGGYHGYCTANPTNVDPGFGTNEDLRNLVHDAHQVGILVVLDIVINHLCDENTNYVGELNHSECADTHAANYWEGDKPVVGMGALNFSQSFFPPLRSNQFFNLCGPNSDADMRSQGTAAVFGDFTAGYFDYRTTDKDFQHIFTELHKYWMAFADVDGFRLDAAKHVTQDFLAYFSTEVRAYARTLGKDNFFVIGEIAASSDWQASAIGSMPFLEPRWDFSGEPAGLVEVNKTLDAVYEKFPEAQRYPGLPAIYNFGLSGRAVSSLTCFNATDLIQTWWGSPQDKDIEIEGVSSQKFWTMLEIHDWARFLAEIPDRADLLRTALAWLLTTPGAPILYYGVEQGYNGICPANYDVGSGSTAGSAHLAIGNVCHSTKCSWGYIGENLQRACTNDDPLKRQDMFLSGPWRLGSAEPQVNKWARIGFPEPALSPPWQNDPMLARDHELYTSARKFAQLRGSCAALLRGEIEWHASSVEPTKCGTMVYSRFIPGTDGSDIFVIINPGGSGTTSVLPMKTTRPTSSSAAGLRYVNAFNTSDVAHAAQDSPHLEVSLERPATVAGEVRIFVREDRLRSFDEALGLARCV